MRSAIVAMSWLVMPVALANQLACPNVAPASLGMGAQPLESVRVMSYPIGVTLGMDREYYATPPMAEWSKAGYLYQSWYVNRDTDKFHYEVDCVYGDNGRHIVLNIGGFHYCRARWLKRRDQGVVEQTLRFVCNK